MVYDCYNLDFWLALTLFAGGVLIRQVFDIPMWQSALILLIISAFFTMLGGLKAVAYTNVYQMILLILVSAALAIVGIYKVGGISALTDAVPADFWNLFRPNDDTAFPWLPIILGYPVMGVWFWCTDQSMVQPVLAAKKSERRTVGNELYRMAQNTGCSSLYSSGYHLSGLVSAVGESR